MRALFLALLFALCAPLAAQTPVYDELEFEPDSITTPYKPGKGQVFVRSKKGTGGVNKVPAADALVSAGSEINEIVLVFSELDASAIAEREEENRERWENLLKTYPDLFQFSTTFKNVCQCKNGGDPALYKESQGFYIYVTGDLPKGAEPAAAATPAAAVAPATVAKTEKAEEKKVEEKKVESKKTEEVPVAKIEKAKVAEPDNTSVKTKEPVIKETPAKEPVQEKQKETKQAEPVKEEVAEEPEPEVEKVTPKKKATPSNKPRRAKDPKACRPSCYQGGDDDLNSFFAKNITFSKKQKKKAKKAIVQVRLQLNVDGSIKKSFITGESEDINKIVEDAVKMMDSWNAAVKSGVTIRSEVKITLKYDSESKSMKPSEVAITPRPGPKCKCMSDSEIFGD